MINKAKHYNILGSKVSSVTIDALHASIEEFINNGEKSLILHVNVNCINLAYERMWLRNFLNSADIVFCDGYGVILGAQLLGVPLAQRITYADWMWQLGAFSEQHGYRFFFLGAQQGIAEKAAESMRDRYPDIQIVGTHHGYFNKSLSNPENEAVIHAINQVQPDILIVALGMPLQERWLMENWDRIDAKIALTGGAVFDYVSGELRRAPFWMTNHGLEWLGRLIIEPGRLWKRYLIGNPTFVWRVLKQKLGLLELE